MPHKKHYTQTIVDIIKYSMVGLISASTSTIILALNVMRKLAYRIGLRYFTPIGIFTYYFIHYNMKHIAVNIATYILTITLLYTTYKHILEEKAKSITPFLKSASSWTKMEIELMLAIGAAYFIIKATYKVTRPTIGMTNLTISTIIILILTSTAGIIETSNTKRGIISAAILTLAYTTLAILLKPNIPVERLEAIGHLTASIITANNPNIPHSKIKNKKTRQNNTNNNTNSHNNHNINNPNSNIQNTTKTSTLNRTFTEMLIVEVMIEKIKHFFNKLRKERGYRINLGITESGEDVYEKLLEWMKDLERKDIRILMLGVIGSRAKGDWKPWSDVDVVLIAEGLPPKGIKRYLLLLSDELDIDIRAYTLREALEALEEPDRTFLDLAYHGIVIVGEEIYQMLKRKVEEKFDVKYDEQLDSWIVKRKK